MDVRTPYAVITDNHIRFIQGQSSGRVGKNEMKKFTAQVRDKLEVRCVELLRYIFTDENVSQVYRRMREDLSALRAELVILQSTEQTLKNKHKNIDEFLTELEKKKGVTVSLLQFK
jgi:hypothetical protein